MNKPLTTREQLDLDFHLYGMSVEQLDNGVVKRLDPTTIKIRRQEITEKDVYGQEPNFTDPLLHGVEINPNDLVKHWGKTPPAQGISKEAITDRINALLKDVEHYRQIRNPAAQVQADLSQGEVYGLQWVLDSWEKGPNPEK